MRTTVIIALGSNKPHGHYGPPEAVLRAAADELAVRGIRPRRMSRIHRTRPIGPSRRCFANAVMVADADAAPPLLLKTLQQVEQAFGRRRGRAWGARVLDLDLIAWGEGTWPDPLRWRTARSGLAIPHRRMHRRDFVLAPLVEVAGDWRHPVLHRTARQLRNRLNRPRPID